MFESIEKQLEQKAKEYSKKKRPICQETEQAFIDGALYILELQKQISSKD